MNQSPYRRGEGIIELAEDNWIEVSPGHDIGGRGPGIVLTTPNENLFLTRDEAYRLELILEESRTPAPTPDHDQMVFPFMED